MTPARQASSRSPHGEDPPPDAELVRLCLEGDERAWEALTLAYADVVYGVARRSGLSGVDAGDVVQETFLALLGALPRLRRRERLLAWILKTARREAWRQVRRHRAARGRERDRARKEAVEAKLPPAALVELEEEQAVRTAFARLTERCRRLLDALFFSAERRSYAEVAAELGLPVGSVGPTRQRCLDALRRALEAEGSFGGDVSRTGGSASRGAGTRTRR